MRKRALWGATLIVALAFGPIAWSQDAPTCADEHLTGADCQGADVNPAPNRCDIKVWVGKASCDFVIPAGAARGVATSAEVWADQGTAPEADMVIRDKSTGTVLYQDHIQQDAAGVDPSRVASGVGRLPDDLATAAQGEISPLMWNLTYGIPHQSVEHQIVAAAWTGGGGTSVPGGSEVTCEVTGTHSKLGAATAAVGETPDARSVPWLYTSAGAPQLYNNQFLCEVQTQATPGPIDPGRHGCVAYRPEAPDYPKGFVYQFVRSYCQFLGNPFGIPTGVISTTTGTYTITHEESSGTVIDISGNGPGVMPYAFTEGVQYTLTVNDDGAGVVIAGSPE